MDASAEALVPDGTYPMQFRIRDLPVGGEDTNILWQESHPSIMVGPEGMFRAVLGSMTPITPSVLPSDGAWLELSVDGMLIPSRFPLGSVPMSSISMDTDHLDGLPFTDMAMTDDVRQVAEVFVTDFGAKGDGVTDDSAAIQSALNSPIIRSFGGQVRFPQGRFRIQTTLQVPANNISLVGAGRNASVLVADNPQVNLLHIPSWRSNVEHLGFEGGATAINISAGAASKVWSCLFKNCGRGITIAAPGSDTIQHYVSDVVMLGITGIGIDLHHCGDVYFKDISILDLPESAYGIVCDTVITAFYGERVSISGGKPITIRHTFSSPDHAPEWLYFNNFHVLNGVGYGIAVNAGHGIVFVDCSVTETQRGPGVVMGSAVNGEVVLKDCRITDNDQDGILLRSNNSNAYTRIEGCAIRGNSRQAVSYAGISVENFVKKFIIQGNGVWNHPGLSSAEQFNAIRVGFGCDDFIISDNICVPHHANGSGVLNLAGTSPSKIVKDNIE